VAKGSSAKTFECQGNFFRHYQGDQGGSWTPLPGTPSDQVHISMFCSCCASHRFYCSLTRGATVLCDTNSVNATARLWPMLIIMYTLGTDCLLHERSSHCLTMPSILHLTKVETQRG